MLGILALAGALALGPAGYVKCHDKLRQKEIEREVSNLRTHTYWGGETVCPKVKIFSERKSRAIKLLKELEND